MMNHKDFLKYEEKCQHGTSMFPFVIYETLIPKYLTFFPAHWHEELEIVYAINGTCIYYIDSKKYIVNKGDILIIPPEKLHSFEQLDNNRFDASVFVFSFNFINNNSLDICSSKYFMPLINGEISFPVFLDGRESITKEACEQLEKITETYVIEDEAFELKTKYQLLQFFYLFFSNRKYISNSNKLTSAAKSSSQIKSIINYIENHYAQKITLLDLSNYSNLSLYHLAHTFKNCTGQSPVEYINQYRLSIAANMLATASIPVIDIASDTGFSNISYFNRAFKAKFNQTPLEYRKSNSTV